MANETSFAALPVRQRGTLETIDTAIKLYRRYFGVLMGWSALVAVLFVLSFTVPFGAFLVSPLIAGSGCCAVAAAVRGQSIRFNQVWDFTKPRYGALLLVMFLSGLIMGTAFGAVFFLAMLISLAGTWLLSSLNTPTEIMAIAAVLGSILAMIAGSILSVVVYAWLGLVPIIVCLEDDNRSSAALGRSWELMKGNWMRVTGLATLLSLAVLAVMGVVGGAIGVFGAGLGAFVEDPSNSAIIGLMLTFSGFFGLFLLFWNPIQTLILAVLYLDLRVRKEALDLEWSAYASAPPPESAPELTAVERSDNASAPEFTPASMSGYAPGSSAPVMAPPPEVATPRPPAPKVTTEKAPAAVSENSSFSSAPDPRVSSAPDAFDFSSAFSAGSDETATFSRDETETELADNTGEKA